MILCLLCSFMCLLCSSCLSGAAWADRAYPEPAVVTRCAATRNAAVADRCVVADHSAVVDRSAAVDRSAEAGRCVVVGRGAAVDRFVARALRIGAFHDVARVGIRVALNVARTAALSAVRKFSWGDFRSVALAVAPVAVRVVALLVFPETTQASPVVRYAVHSAVHSLAHCAVEDCYAAAVSLLPVGRAGASPLLPASPVAHSDPAAPAVLQARLT